MVGRPIDPGTRHQDIRFNLGCLPTVLLIVLVIFLASHGGELAEIIMNGLRGC